MATQKDVKRKQTVSKGQKIAKKALKEPVVYGTKIFDDIYHTIITRMPQFIIPVINDAFGTRYPMDVDFEQLSNEFYSLDGKMISDSIFLIRGRIYHVECQSNPDDTMSIRMFEYGLQIGLNRARKKRDLIHVELPESVVLYLRHNSKTPDKLMVEVKSPKGDTLTYESKVIKVQNYTKDVIFRKKLLLYLPFYVMRYEKERDKIEKDPALMRALLKDYKDILTKLGKVLEADESSELYSDLVDLIKKISDYIFRDQKETRKEIENMGGQVLELYSDKIKRTAKNDAQEEIVNAVKDIRNGLKLNELKKKYDAETIKRARAIS